MKWTRFFPVGMSSLRPCRAGIPEKILGTSSGFSPAFLPALPSPEDRFWHCLSKASLRGAETGFSFRFRPLVTAFLSFLIVPAIRVAPLVLLRSLSNIVAGGRSCVAEGCVRQDKTPPHGGDYPFVCTSFFHGLHEAVCAGRGCFAQSSDFLIPFRRPL